MTPPSGVDFVQEKFLGQGPQDNESAVEQAKDEQISDFIRGSQWLTLRSQNVHWSRELILKRRIQKHDGQ